VRAVVMDTDGTVYGLVGLVVRSLRAGIQDRALPTDADRSCLLAAATGSGLARRFAGCRKLLDDTLHIRLTDPR
jgi:phosphoglycolate phosphatase-like HAD superfamily hydrolase